MGIGIKLDDLSDELKDYSEVAFTLSYAMEQDSETRHYSATAFVLYKGLNDVIAKMNVLAERIIAGDQYCTLKEAIPRKHWVLIDSGRLNWYLATEKQIDLVRKALSYDESKEGAPDGSE